MAAEAEILGEVSTDVCWEIALLNRLRFLSVVSLLSILSVRLKGRQFGARPV